MPFVALLPGSAVCSQIRDVRSARDSGAKADIGLGPLGAISRHMHRGKENLYSTTASARATIDGGTARPSTFAVLRLMTNSTVVDRSTGRSAGFTPPRILPTKPAARLAFSLRFGP